MPTGTRSAELQAFLRACRARPDEDTPRLVLADWLEEQGDPRGEFVRIQVQRARLPDWDPRQTALARREAFLLGESQRSWLGPLARHTRQHRFHRGFLVLELDETTPLADRTLEAAPEWIWVNTVCLSQRDATRQAFESPICAGVTHLYVYYPDDPQTYLRDLVQSPRLADVTSLHLEPGGYFTDEDAALLAASPHVRRLTSLHLHGGPTPEGLITLLASPNLQGLRRLDCETTHLSGPSLAALGRIDHPALAELRLFGADLGPEGARHLARAPFLPRLRSLALSVTHLGTQGMLALLAAPLVELQHLEITAERMTVGAIKALAQSPYLSNLRSLTLSEDQMGLGPMKALARSPRLGQLDRLDLQGNHLEDECVTLLAQSPYVAALRDLNLSRNRMGKSGAAALANSAIANLGVLDLGYNGIGTEGLLALLPWLERQRLVHLDLGNTFFDSNGIAALAQSRALPDLIHMDLSGNSLADGMPALASAEWLRGLVTLDLFATRTGPAGLRRLLDSGRLDLVRTLSLSLAEIGDEGAHQLAQWPGLAKLTQLDLRGNGISDAGFRALADSPHLREGLHLHINEPGLIAGSPPYLVARIGASVSSIHPVDDALDLH